MATGAYFSGAGSARDVNAPIDGNAGVAVCRGSRQSWAVTRISNISQRRQSARSDGSADYAAKRAELLRVAADLFKKQGYHSTKLSDIAREVGLDRATIYYYAGSKEELFHETVETVLNAAIQAAIDYKADASLRSIERLHAIFVALMVGYEENYPATFVYIQEQMHQLGSEKTQWAQDIMKKTRAFDQMLLGFIKGAMDEGDLRNDIPIRLVENALFGMLNWTHRWFVPGRGMSGREVAEAFWSIFTGGMMVGADRSLPTGGDLSAVYAEPDAPVLLRPPGSAARAG
jgi:AcrR family transcriptional regulator